MDNDKKSQFSSLDSFNVDNNTFSLSGHFQQKRKMQQASSGVQLNPIETVLEVGKLFGAAKAKIKDAGFPPVRAVLPFKIEVIDDTALIGSFPLSKNKKNGKHGIDDHKKGGRRSRRKGKKIAKRVSREEEEEAVDQLEKESKHHRIMYSRKELEELRFVNGVKQQHDFWKEVYDGLGTAVIEQYQDLASCKHHNNIGKKAGSPSNMGRGKRFGGANIFVH